VEKVGIAVEVAVRSVAETEYTVAAVGVVPGVAVEAVEAVGAVAWNLPGSERGVVVIVVVAAK
jgi:hypothetical protein